MTVQLPIHLDKPGFINWVERQEGRYELVGGRVVMMPGASRGHGLIVRNLVVLLHNQLDPREWTVIADFGLDLGPETLRYPDIVVDRAGGGLGEHVATAPVLIAEVLSPSTAEIDLGDKAAEYLQIPTLSAYLVFAQNQPKAWVWMHRSNGFASAPTVIIGSDKTVYVARLNLSLPLAAVYAGIDASSAAGPQ